MRARPTGCFDYGANEITIAQLRLSSYEENCVWGNDDGFLARLGRFFHTFSLCAFSWLFVMSFFNFGGDFSSTPKRPLNAKSPTIPFCTSPSQLQEVTLDQDVTFSNTMGLRSPGGPMRGRSVKEIEDQLSNLKKENFNLKLRIYFLEEKMGAHFTLDKDNIVKKYIELQVEYGNLQKELDEKHDLLCQAVKAMELEEEEHKKYVSSKEDQLSVCQQELDELRMQLQDTKFDSDGISLKSDTTGFYSNRALNNGNLISDLQEKVKMLETELHAEKETNASLQFILGHAETLKSRLETTQRDVLAKDATIRNLHQEIEAGDAKTMAQAEQIASLRADLSLARRENDALARRARRDADAIERLQEQAVLSPTGATPPDAACLSAAAPAGDAQARGGAGGCPPVEGESSLRAKVGRLRREQFKACEIIKTMMASRGRANEEAARLRAQVQALERELESVVSRPGGDGGQDGCEKSMAKSDAEEEKGMAEHYKALTVELEAKIEILVATLNEKDVQMQNIKKQYDQILICLEEKENKLADMEFELLCSENADASTSFTEKHEIYKQEIEEKDKKIEALTEDLRKCTCHLQEIVNKELWDKNKEIEKLHNKYSNTTDTCKLRKELTQRGEQLERLQAEISNLRTENERSEKLRRESNEVCSLLNSRLEELAMFLDSLLKNKSVLGFLGLQKERRLRGLINNSLDISKSFATSMMVPGDQTLAQLSNITALLDGSEFHLSEIEDRESLSIVPGDITLTYQSHLHKKDTPDNESVIVALREQIVNLKSELQLRDNELNRLNVLSNQTSESEAVPRDVSKLSPAKCNTSTTLKCRSECHSESEGWSEPDRVVSRERMGLSQTAPELFGESTEEESASSLTPTKKRNLEPQQEVHREALEELKGRLVEAEASLAEARQRKEEAEVQMDALQRAVEELNIEKEVLRESVVDKDKKIKDLLNVVEAEKAEAKRMAEGYEQEAVKAKQDIEERDLKLKELQQELRLSEKKAEDELKQLEDLYASEYVKKSEVEGKLLRVELLLTEMDDLKLAVSTYESTLRSYKEKNEVISSELAEYQDAVNALRTELDTTTLQYSQAVLERTKLAAAKAALEDELERRVSKDVELQQQIAEIRAEFDRVNESCQGQIGGLQRQKSLLEVRLSEMESANAQLHNRLVKLQACRGDVGWSVCSDAGRGTYRQYPDVDYPIDDRPSDHPHHRHSALAAAPLPPPTEAERREANSSPDLGIDSDHGRLSSLEAAAPAGGGLRRPLLQTLELTESMSNLLDGEGDSESVGFCESDHCCPRTSAYAQENAELKRKLLRMRRALEETATQLNLANQRKKQVEKVICKQIHKTSQVLRKAKANLDSGSESDLLNK